MKERLQTRKRLEENYHITDDDRSLRLYNHLIAAQNAHKYAIFGTTTFNISVTDVITATDVNRKFKCYLTDFYYRRKTRFSELKFFFIVERHFLRDKFQSRLHTHFFITLPKNPVIDLKSEKYKSYRYNFPKAIRRPFRLMSIFTQNGLQVRPRCHLEQIYDQENIADYCLKKLNVTTFENFDVDYLNSDLNFKVDTQFQNPFLRKKDWE